MFSVLSTQFRDSINDVKSVVGWQEDLRQLVHGALGAEHAQANTSLSLLNTKPPQKLAWQIFDHCAAVSRLYALFEQTICDLVTEYTGLLPTVVPKFSDLCDRSRNQLRIGIGTILTKWGPDKPLYSSIREESIAAGFADGLRGKPYHLLADAFLVSPENFRSTALGRLFSDLGFDDAISFARKYEGVRQFIETRLSSTETLESYLDLFVRTRNESSHGNISTIASAKQIIDYADFLCELFNAFAILLRSDILKRGTMTGQTQDVAEILHVYTGGIYGASAVAILNSQSVNGFTRERNPLAMQLYCHSRSVETHTQPSN